MVTIFRTEDCLDFNQWILRSSGSQWVTSRTSGVHFEVLRNNYESDRLPSDSYTKTDPYYRLVEPVERDFFFSSTTTPPSFCKTKYKLETKIDLNPYLVFTSFLVVDTFT